MYEEFEVSGFHITTDPEFHDNRNHIAFLNHHRYKQNRLYFLQKLAETTPTRVAAEKKYKKCA